jgi:hypothetical protein
MQPGGDELLVGFKQGEGARQEVVALLPVGL